MAGLSINWIPLTRDHASTKADIDALRVRCENIADLYAFWNDHLGCCPKGQRKYFSRKLGRFYGVFLKVPRADELECEVEGEEGVVQYINKDYFEGSDDTHHKLKVGARLTEVWQEMTVIHAEVMKWTLTGEDTIRYDTVRETAFASVCKWLNIPSFKGRRHREENGSRVASQATHKPRKAHSIGVRALLQMLESVYEENIPDVQDVIQEE
jgi:hypothetical protein